MKLICIAKRWQDLPQKTLDTTGYTNVSFDVLKIGSQYIVYGMRVECGVAHYLLTIHPSNTWPSWYPSDFFKIIDPLVYNEWYCHVYYDQEDLNVMWGYKELFSPIHLSGLLEREPEDIRIFEKRKQEIDEYEALSPYISKKSEALGSQDMPKSSIYKDESVDQRECSDTLKDFLEKYLNGQIGVQQFTQRYSTFYEQRINYKKLTQEEETIMKEFRTVVENYAPYHINPGRVYASEEEVNEAAQKTLECVKANHYLASLCSEY